MVYSLYNMSVAISITNHEISITTRKISRMIKVSNIFG